MPDMTRGVRELPDPEEGPDSIRPIPAHPGSGAASPTPSANPPPLAWFRKCHGGMVVVTRPRCGIRGTLDVGLSTFLGSALPAALTGNDDGVIANHEYRERRDFFVIYYFHGGQYETCDVYEISGINGRGTTH